MATRPAELKIRGNLAPAQTSTDPLYLRVQAALELCRPGIQLDGGDAELVDVQDGVARIRFHGACNGCPSSPMTLRHTIERTIKDHVPEISSVVPV